MRRVGKKKIEENRSEGEAAVTGTEEKNAEPEAEAGGIDFEEELQKEKDRYIRLYAEFENYKKRVQKDKEELVKYGIESLVYEMLPVLDNLEMALKHSTDGSSSAPGEGLVQGVEITLKEFLKVMEKFGVVPITALNKAFDPSLHHAMTQIERDDVNENTVVEEYRKGYMLKDKLLRESLVAVSKKSEGGSQIREINEEENNKEHIEEEE